MSKSGYINNYRHIMVLLFCWLNALLVFGQTVPSAYVTDTPEPVYQLFLWMKSGFKTGYLASEKPQFRYEAGNICFTTTNLTLTIPDTEFDKFTLEQVLPEHPKSISMLSEMKLGLGRTHRMSYVLNPVDAVTEVTWFNENDDVVGIDNTGLLTGRTVGTSVVTAQTSNGLRAQCIVTVPEPRWVFYVWLRGGGKVGYGIDEKPEVTIGDDIFTLVTHNLTVRYPVDQVLRFTLEDAALVTAEDVNVDGKSDTQDVLGIYEYMQSGKSPNWRLNYDVNFDGKVDTQDVLKVYEHIKQY